MIVFYKLKKWTFVTVRQKPDSTDEYVHTLYAQTNLFLKRNWGKDVLFKG